MLKVTKCFVGDKWKARRRLLTPAFHFQILNDFIEIMNKESLVLSKVLKKQLESQEEDQEIDIYPLVADCTLDIICGKSFI